MTPSVPPTVVYHLLRGDPAVSLSTGLVLLGVLFVAVVAKVLLQAGDAQPQAGRGVLHLLDVVVAPTLVVFLLIVLERFRDLS